MVEPIYNNFTQAFVAGQAAGRKLRQQRVTDNALAKYAAGDTAGGIRDLTTVDPDAAAGLQKQQRDDEAYTLNKTVGAQVAGGDIAGGRQAALSAGNFDMANSLDHLDDKQIATAQAHAATIASVGIRLKSMPQEQWIPTLQALKPSLIARGFKPEEVDQAVAAIQQGGPGALDGIIGQAMTLHDTLDQQNKERDDAETLRHHKEVEGQMKVLGNGAVGIDPDTGAVVARNPKTFAPARSGAKPGIGSHSLPAGFKVQ